MKPRISYIICTTQRTGSYLLRKALQSTNIAGNPEELWFLPTKKLQVTTVGPAPIKFTNSIEKLVDRGTTPNGVFGCMLTWRPFRHFCAWAKHNTNTGHTCPAELMETFFPNPKYVYLSRRDMLAQAVSLVKAHQTTVWSKLKDSPRPYAAEPLFDFNQIDNALNHIIEDDRHWQDYFKRYGIKPFRATYEDLSNTLQSITFDLLRYLGVPFPQNSALKEPSLEKQADALSDMWVERYKTMLQSYNKPTLFLKRLLYKSINCNLELKRFRSNKLLFLR